MILPEGFFNTRYIFAAAGVLDPMSFAIGGQADPGLNATEIADLCYNAAAGTILTTSTAINASYTVLGTQTVKTVGGQPTVGEFNFVTQGTATGDGVIVNTCVLVRKVTASGGRKNRGRCFVPAYQENNADIDTAGNLTPSHVDALQDQWEAFHTELGALGVPPWLMHSHPDDEPTPIQAFLVQGLMATQRRRMR